MICMQCNFPYKYKQWVNNLLSISEIKYMAFRSNANRTARLLKLQLLVVLLNFSVRFGMPIKPSLLDSGTAPSGAKRNYSPPNLSIGPIHTDFPIAPKEVYNFKIVICKDNYLFKMFASLSSRCNCCKLITYLQYWHLFIIYEEVVVWNI